MSICAIRASATPGRSCTLSLEERLRQRGLIHWEREERRPQASVSRGSSLSLCGMQTSAGPPRDPRERPCSSVMHSLPRGAIPPARLDSLRERRAPSASKRESRFIAKPLWHADLCRAPAWSARAIPKVHGSKKTLSSNIARAHREKRQAFADLQGRPASKRPFSWVPASARREKPEAFARYDSQPAKKSLFPTVSREGATKNVKLLQILRAAWPRKALFLGFRTLLGPETQSFRNFRGPKWPFLRAF